MDSLLPHLIAQGFSKISLALRSHEQQGATTERLSPTQGLILARLHTMGPLTLSRLSTDLSLTPATLSDAVATLATKQLITKQPSPTDARSHTIHLTPSGHDVATRTSLWPDFLATAAASLPLADQQALHRALIHLILTLQQQGHISTARMCVSCKFFRPDPLYCTYVDAPLAPTDLRIDCPEFQIQ
jgi:DNA-binding MarR family transcriptional regulator